MFHAWGFFSCFSGVWFWFVGRFCVAYLPCFSFLLGFGLFGLGVSGVRLGFFSLFASWAWRWLLIRCGVSFIWLVLRMVVNASNF